MSDRNAPYARYFSVNRLSPGRAALVARQILRIADEFGEAALVDLAARLLASADHYGTVGHGRRSQSGSRGEGSAYKVDRQVDRNVKGYAEQLETVIADYGEEHPLGVAAIALRGDTVPQGHYAVTGLPYEDELQAVERIVDRLRSEDRALLAEMNVLYYLDRFEELLPAYVEALEVRRIITTGDVKTAREEMHRDLCNVVGFICARFGIAEAQEQRDRLLAPVDDQQDRISALARARRLGGQAAADAMSAEAAEEAALDALLDEELALDVAEDEAGSGSGSDDSGSGEAAQPEAVVVDASGVDAVAAGDGPIALPQPSSGDR